MSAVALSVIHDFSIVMAVPLPGDLEMTHGYIAHSPRLSSVVMTTACIFPQSDIFLNKCVSPLVAAKPSAVEPAVASHLVL